MLEHKHNFHVIIIYHWQCALKWDSTLTLFKCGRIFWFICEVTLMMYRPMWFDRNANILTDSSVLTDLKDLWDRCILFYCGEGPALPTLTVWRKNPRLWLSVDWRRSPWKNKRQEFFLHCTVGQSIVSWSLGSFLQMTVIFKNSVKSITNCSPPLVG